MDEKLIACGLAACAAAVASPALAEPLAVQLEYHAPDGCPARDTFVRDVLRRVSHLALASEGEAARRFEVDVSTSPREAAARLTFVDDEGQRVEREIRSRDCNQAVSGIALVTALAIDPRLALDDSPAPESAADEEPPRLETPSKLQPTRIDSGVTREPPSAADTWSWTVGAEAGPVSDVAPGLTASALLFAELGPSDTLRARLSAGYADSGERAVGDGAARFRLSHGRGELCPTAAALAPLTLRPCAALELGLYHAAGSRSPRVAVPKESSTTWFAGLVALRAELALGDVLALELAGQLRAPLLRRDYVFERPETPAYRTPSLGGGVLLGAGARL